MSDNTVHSDPVLYKITVVTDETNVNVTQGITKVVQVSTPGPQGPSASNIYTTPQHPLPINLPVGSFAVSSSSPPKPYFWDGTTWNALY